MEKETAIRGHFFHLVKDSFPLMDQESDSVQSLKGGLILIDRDNGMVSDLGSNKELSNRLDDHQVEHPLDGFFGSRVCGFAYQLSPRNGSAVLLNQLFNCL